jgi:hypothetical protein
MQTPDGSMNPLQLWLVGAEISAQADATKEATIRAKRTSGRRFMAISV